MPEQPYLFVDCESFSRQLQAVTEGSLQVSEFRAWLVRLLSGDNIEFNEQDEETLGRVVGRLENSETEERLRTLASDFQRLLSTTGCGEDARLLIEIVEDRERVVQVLDRYLAGILSRTGYLSYLTEQRWPRDIRARLGEFTSDQLEGIRDALQRREFGLLRNYLFD
jgi:hypothetical protein